MAIDIVGVLITLILGLLGVLIIFLVGTKKRRELETDDIKTIESLKKDVSRVISEYVSEESGYGMTEEEYQREYKTQQEIITALRESALCIDDAKLKVKGIISNYLKEVFPDEMAIAKHFNFAESELSTMWKFEILLHFFKKKSMSMALTEIIEEYKLDEPRFLTDGEARKSCAILAQDIEAIYHDKYNKMFTLEYQDKIEILSTFIYQKYKGLGAIDTLREMSINGVNIGSSGEIENLAANIPAYKTVLCSCWIFYDGKQIHLPFINFGTKAEIKRIVLTTIAAGKDQLTEKKGYVTASMYDQTRVQASRPPVYASWAVFLRKFNLGKVTVEKLVNRPDYNRCDIPIRLLRFKMYGELTTVYTGQQGTGKTTLMQGDIGNVHPMTTIRTLETVRELHLRRLYPQRNVIEAEETPYVSLEKIQDAYKKMDSELTIVGEVAQHIVADKFIQTCQVASKFGLASHHAVTAVSLVEALRNSVVASGTITDINIAEQQVVSVLKLNVHLDKFQDGRRFIARITEIIPITGDSDYPEYDPSNPDSINPIKVEYYKKQTEKRSFYVQDIMVFNKDTLTYEIKNIFSEATLEHMKNVMSPDDFFEMMEMFREELLKDKVA